MEGRSRDCWERLVLKEYGDGEWTENFIMSRRSFKKLRLSLMMERTTCPQDKMLVAIALCDTKLLQNLSFLNVLLTCPKNASKTRLISTYPAWLNLKMLNNKGNNRNNSGILECMEMFWLTVTHLAGPTGSPATSLALSEVHYGWFWCKC